MATAGLSRRRMTIYSLAVLLPAAVLMYYGLVTALRERRMMRDLVQANRILAEERLAAEFDATIRLGAEDCLKRAQALDASRYAHPLELPGCDNVDQLFIVDTDGWGVFPRSAVAQRFAQDLRYGAPAVPGMVYPVAYLDPPIAQLFYMSPGGRSRRILALSLDLNHVSGDNFAAAQKITRISGRLVPAVTLSRDRPLPRTLFPFWEISASPPADDQSVFQRTWLVIALLIGTVFCLSLGLYGLTQEDARERRAAEIHANFVTGVAHELRTPVTAINAYAEMLEDPQRFTALERVPLLEGLRSQTAELDRRITNVLRFSELSYAGRIYEFKPADLSLLVSEMLDQHRLRLEQQALAIDVSLEAALPKASVDTEAVKDAVLNLLDNAAKYSTDRCQAVIRTYSREARDVVIEVRDYGIGIPAEQHKRIFDAFYRVRGITRKGGFGIGLYLVNQIMEAHNGRVELESRVGAGSVFRLVFPKAEPV